MARRTRRSPLPSETVDRVRDRREEASALPLRMAATRSRGERSMEEPDSMVDDPARQGVGGGKRLLALQLKWQEK